MKGKTYMEGQDHNRAPTEPPEPLMNIEELAAFLNVPKSWLYGKTRTAERTGFPVVRVGKYVRFDRRKVLEYLNRGADPQII